MAKVVQHDRTVIAFPCNPVDLTNRVPRTRVRKQSRGFRKHLFFDMQLGLREAQNTAA